MDQASVEALYRKYGPIVLRRARTILGDDALARDAMHEVFVRLLHDETELREQTSPLWWLYRITTNYCLNLLRDSSRRRELMRAHLPAEPGRSDGTEAQLLIVQLLERLPADLREIAVYYPVDHMSHQEIAELMNVSRRTIGNRLGEFQKLARELAAG
jgi:RNA polymerase sigma-70 factor (ECF subfamily)